MIEKTTYALQWIHGARRPGVDECDQGWLNVRLDPHIDRSNLLQMVNECALLQQDADGAFTFRVVCRDGGVEKLVA